MTLSEWIAKEGLTQRQAAARLGVDETALCRYVRGRGMPSIPVAGRIARNTKGEVPMESWLEKDSAPAQARASR